MTTYVVKQVDLDIGFVVVEVHLPDNTEVDVTLDITSVAASSEATEAELRHALNQLVDQYVLSLIPPERPRPTALSSMVGLVFDSSGV